MTRTEFKSILKSYIGKKEYDDATALLLDWDGCNEITVDDVNDYGCTLGDVMNTLDTIGVYHELKGLGSDSGMYIHIPICR